MTNPMSITAAARIQAVEAKANGGRVSSGSFAARAQAGAANNNRSSNGSSSTGRPSGKGLGKNSPKGK